MGILRAEEHAEADDANHGNEDVAETAATGAVSDEANDDGEHGGEGIGWYGEQLGFGGLVTHGGDDRGEKERECVKWHVATHIDDHPKPGSC